MRKGGRNYFHKPLYACCKELKVVSSIKALIKKICRKMNISKVSQPTRLKTEDQKKGREKVNVTENKLKCV